MYKGIITTCLALALFAISAEVANAQCGGQHGCRISNAFNGLVGNAFGGANCGREISNNDARALWAGYCTDDCSINSGCGGGCGGGCGSFQNFAPQPVYAAPVTTCGHGCDGGCGRGHGCLGGKLRGLFAGLRSGGGCGCGNQAFGYPSGGCGGGCGAGCGGGCDSGCGGAAVAGHFHGGGCGGKLRGLLSRGCGCKLFSRGNFHDRAFSTFYATHSSASYFGGYVGPETGFGDFTSAVNGQITGCCGGSVLQSQPVQGHAIQGHNVMQPTQTRGTAVRSNEASPVMPAEVEANPRSTDLGN